MKRSFIDQQFDAQHEDYLARFPDGTFLLIQNRMDPIGRLYLDLNSSSLRLIDVTLLPVWQGRGIGSAILRGLQDLAAAQPGGRVDLAVDPMNPRARALYERHGFRVEQVGPSRLFMRWIPVDPPRPVSGSGNPDVHGEA
jgi:ribosomal protein S18 acetylase RimI-like enzyme